MTPETNFQLLMAYIKKNPLRTCLIEGCENQAIINAHSIQNKNVIESLQEGGHVYVGKYDPEEEFVFERISRNKASTFNGYCAVHDNELFKELDKGIEIIDEGISKMQSVLLHLRAVSREIWAKANTIKNYGNLAKIIDCEDDSSLKMIFPPLNSEKSIDWNWWRKTFHMLDDLCTGNQMGLNDFGNNLESLIYQVKTNKLHHTKSYNIILSPKAKFALSGYITPLYCFEGRRLNNLEANKVSTMSVSAIPLEDSTVVSLSWHKKDDPYLNILCKQLDRYDDLEKQEIVSKFILTSSENFVYSPKLVDAMSKEDKKVMKELMYCGSVNLEYDFLKLPSINLFKY